MKYTGYKSEQRTIEILRKQYPKFVASCEFDKEGYVHTNKSLIRIISKKVNYDINLHNLTQQTGQYNWIPADRDDELNGLLNYIEEHPEIPLMSEL